MSCSLSGFHCVSLLRHACYLGLPMQVSYQGWRRFKLLTVDHDSKPYPMAAATWLDDDAASLSQEQQAATDALEQEVYGLLQQVASYMRQLEQGAGGAGVSAPPSGPTGVHGGGGSSSSSSSGGSSSKAQRPLLPDSVLLFAPPPPSRQQSVADYLIKAGWCYGWCVVWVVVLHNCAVLHLVHDVHQASAWN
jgi:hypothetical protein